MVLTHAVAVNIAKPCQIGEQRTRNHHKASQSSIQVLLSLKKDCDVIIAISTIILYIYIYILCLCQDKLVYDTYQHNRQTIQGVC